MISYKTLPEGYKEIYALDLKKDKKLSLLINVIAVIIAVVMVVPVSFHIPIKNLISMEWGLGRYFLRFIVMLSLGVLYVILHELVHGVAMKLCGTEKIKYGFTGIYAFAGSADYYDKKSYIFIALAPVVLWGAVIGIINPFVPVDWFWVVYLIQITNISGAAGDMYVTLKFSRMPRDILITDYGVGMKVYSKYEDRRTV